MEKLKEPKYYQIYELHMKNGEVLRVSEDYDIPAKDSLIGMFKRKEVEFLEYTDILHGYTVPIDQISFIIAAEVEKGL